MVDSGLKDEPGKKARLNEIKSPPSDAEILTIGEVAYVLRGSVSSVRRMIEAGMIAVVPSTVGGRRLVERSELDDYLRRTRHFVRGAAEMTPEEKVEAKAREARKLKSIVVADWNTGEDLLGLDGPRPGRPRKKPKPHAGGGP